MIVIEYATNYVFAKEPNFCGCFISPIFNNSNKTK